MESHVCKHASCTAEAVPSGEAGPLFGGAAADAAGMPVQRRAIGGGSASPRRHDDASRGLRLLKGVLIAAAAVAALGAGAYALPGLYEWVSDPSKVREFVAQNGLASRMAMLGINVLQVIVAVLPGEPIELASGYAFGFWEGTALCLVASAVGSSLVFWAVRRWGKGAVGVFFSTEKLKGFAWLENVRRLELIMLIVFLIPGTPKDVLTYLAGLTSIRYEFVLVLSTVGRMPSIVSSTLAASAFGQGDYGVAATVLGLSAALAVAGAVLYGRLRKASR